MNLKEYYARIKNIFLKKPFILLAIFAISLCFLIIFLNPTNIQHLFYILFAFGLIILTLITIIFYKYYERPFDDLFFPLFTSIALLSYSVILLILFFGFNSVYLKIEPNLNHLNFPLAIFALGVTLCYFIIGQFLTEKKMDLILTEIKNIKNSYTSPSTEIKSEIPSLERQCSNISDEENLIYSHLFQRHQNLLVFGDSIDTKFAQIIALNGLILSLVLIKYSEVNYFNIYIFGIVFILIAIGIGFYGYKSREWLTGVNEEFFDDYDSFSPGEGIKKLKKRLVTDIKHNTNVQNQKADTFNIMLLFNMLGFFMLVVGYYG